ncbi:glucose-1-phosphate adenylyltransferase [Flavobacterium silvaticum]|uniref:Glucose-1-phosphate adenylyltransferase n=1 Tax=Flavobacterium silvaticum TaxID=1852020 RepID=A0A972FKZ7_9FLAO|nr:glucose-1-phosphate adenylyltransferase [Flavobacterium silvaticum]NMH27954.1 glucose-1-phosphate adenylyltransferase [Flavobacterium silvaticum]
MMRNKSLAIILGGGQGSRLAPLTNSRSKPAVPIAGKYRLVDIPISNCINSDIKRIFVLTQFNSASLNQHIKNTYHFSSFSTAFVDILAAEQTPENAGWFQGTADAVRQCMNHFLNHEFEYALILSGDQLYQMDFNEMIKKHEESGAEISIATLPVNSKDAPGFGIMKTDADDVVTAFIEKPKPDVLHEWTSPVSEEMQAQGKHYLASMGIYVFNRDLLVKLMSDQSTTDFGKEIMPQSVGKHKMRSFQYEGYWTDIGNIDSFFEANLELTDEIPQFNLFDNANRIYTRARILPPTKIIGESKIRKGMIAEGCILHGCTIDRSVIGIRTRIGKDTEIHNSYVMGSDHYQNLKEIYENLEHRLINIGIGERCYLNNTIVDKNCRIGNDVYLNGGSHLADSDHELYTVKDGIIVVKKNAAVPDGFRVGDTTEAI